MENSKEFNDIDIKENYIYSLDKALLSLLLKDRSSDKNIIWATDTYAWRGAGFEPQDYITVKSITGRRGNVIKPRTQKSQKEQRIRIKKKAEVFTPSWICNEMANHIDDVWFGRENVFNTPSDTTWKVNENKIAFDFIDHNAWQEYVELKVLEIACGEAPFLASRYDTVTGKWLDVKERIGLLDRKLRIISENTDNEQDWVNWAFKAYKATYGYEWQGDSLLIARENLLFTFIDYYVDRFNHYPINEYLIEIAKILSWNIWQMDALKGVIPYSCKPLPSIQLSFFNLYEPLQECPGCSSNNNRMHTGIYCKIKNWKSNKNIYFISDKGDKKMKFDFVIGNPPYQGEVGDSNNKTFMPAVYYLFMDASYQLSDRVELVHPARFLFNAGQTPKSWNQKMLDDPHFKVLRYEPDGSKIFPTTDIKGGIVISYHDNKQNFGAIKTFTAFPELNSILNKSMPKNDADSIMNIIHAQNRFNLEALYLKHPEFMGIIGSDGKDKRFRNNIFEKISCFTTEKTNEDDIRILGITNNKRVWKYIPKEFIDLNHENIRKWKVLVPSANGSGAIGEVLSTPLVGEPLVGYTQSFIGVGAFDTCEEANATMKYIKSKYARTMLGILKSTQHNPAPTWRYVPNQDFTVNSDIDWSKSVHEIDLQLYKKYGLDDKEISFIETHIKEMK